MKPMSHTKRRVYLLGFSILFFILTPLVIFYAMGYRFGFVEKFVVTERGGVYVQTSIPGTDIYLDDELKDTTGIFNQEYLSQSIKPGRYFVRAVNEGYRTWEKYVQVDAQRVTSLYPFLVPEEFEFEEILQVVEKPQQGTTTIDIAVNDVYKDFVSLFVLAEATTTKDLITASDVIDIEEGQDVIKRVFGDVQVWYDEDEQQFYVEWLARGDFLPSYFCENGECINPFVFLKVTSPVTHFDFYPGRDDVIIFAVENGSVNAVEVDKRPQQTSVEIYSNESGAPVDFRLVGRDTLVIKDGEKILTTELER